MLLPSAILGPTSMECFKIMGFTKALQDCTKMLYMKLHLSSLPSKMRLAL